MGKIDIFCSGSIRAPQRSTTLPQHSVTICSTSVTFRNAQLLLLFGTKHIFVKYLKYKILFKLIAVEDRPSKQQSNFIAL